MEANDNNTPRKKGGRHSKKDPAIHRYSISFNSEENAQFLSLFDQSGMNVMAHFIIACIFERNVRIVKTDKAAMEYYVRLTNLFGQFRAIGVNYNQVVKILYRDFSEKKAAAYLYKLEKRTTELAVLSQKIIQLTAEFETNYLKKM